MRRPLLATTTAVILLLTSGGVVSAQGANTGTVASAQSKACWVRNTSTGQISRRLQRAVDTARPRDRLVVKGTCVGGTVIKKSLTVVGVRTKHSGKAKLSGGGEVGVLTVGNGVRVRLRDLEIVHGRAKKGAGIRNRGLLILAGVQVRRNSASPLGPGRWSPLGSPGGIFNLGTIRANGSTRIAHNRGDSGASGVFNRGTFVLNGESVIAYNGGVYGNGVDNAGTFIMNGSSAIKRNWSTDTVGGVSNWGTFVMNDRSTISHNDGGTSWGGPGGVSNSGAFTMNDASAIHGNHGEYVGGGAYNTGGPFTMNDASAIHGNESTCAGGGVYITGGTFTMTGGSGITDNEAMFYDPFDCEPPGIARGGGMYQSGGSLVGVTCGAAARVNGNTPDDCYFD